MIRSLRSSKNLTCAYYDPDNPIGDGSSNSPHYWDNICSFERTTAVVAGLSSESYGRVYVKVFLKQGVTYKIGVTDGREYNKNQDTAIWLSADDGSYKIERVDQDGFAWMYGILCTEGDNVTPKQDGIWTISPGNMSGSNSITRTICIDPPPGRILGENAGPTNDSNKVSLIGTDDIGFPYKYQDLNAATIRYLGIWRNNKYTKFYLNQTRNDISLGNATPITFIESNISWDSQNNMVCNDNGSSYIVLQNFDSNVFAAGSQWTIDMWFKLSSNANNYEYNNLICQTNNSSGNNYLNESIGLGIRYMKLTRYYFAENCIDSTSAPTLDVSLEKSRWYHAAVEKMLIDNIWHLFYYLDGNIVCNLPLKKEILPFKSHSVSLPSGSSDDNGRRFRGLICRPRISSTAIFGGKNFVIGDRII